MMILRGIVRGEEECCMIHQLIGQHLQVEGTAGHQLLI